MSFEKYICWNPDEISKIIHTEAEATEKEVFLAIHTDTKVKVSTHGAAVKNTSYQDFLKSFLDENNGNNVQAVIEGESGSGKSHLVQWMRFNIPKNNKRIILTIPKTQTNLFSILKKLISYLPYEEQIKYEEKLHRTESGLKNDRERINEFLSSLARTIEKDIPQGLKVEEEQYLIPLIPKLFDDPYFRDSYFNSHEIVDNIISLIFNNSGINRNSDHRQEFKQKHLPLNPKEATKASQSTQEVLEAIQEEELLKISLEIINRNLDKAITRTLSFSPDDLIELMSDIRSTLYKNNQELILLIEDFAQLQGVDTALLQVLTVEGSGELCKLKWVMAVTTGYFEKLEDTVRTRITFKVNMDNPKDSDQYIMQLGSKYLNAIRLGNEKITLWNESNESSITNSCNQCKHKEICHKSFGAVDNIGLYPFNEISLLQMAKKADIEKSTIFRPRIFINKVLKRNLQNDMVQLLKEGSYPPENLLEDFGSKHLSVEEIAKSKKLDLVNHDRRYTLIELWSNSRSIINLDEGIHNSFSIPRLKDIPSGVITSNLESKVPENNIGEVKASKIDRDIEHIDNWGRGDVLKHSVASTLRPIIYNEIINYIDWDFMSISLSMRILKKSENIYFEGQETRPKNGFNLEIKQNIESAIILKKFLNTKFPINIEEYSKVKEQVKLWSEYIINETEKYYAPMDNWNPVKASIELLVLSSIYAAEKPTINSIMSENMNYSDMASSQFNALSKIISNATRDNIYQDLLQKTYTGRKGGTKTKSFIDVKKILPIIKELKNNNWRLQQDPILETRKEFLEIKDKYEQWKSIFDNALTEELVARYSWLDELINRVEIEDIGVAFRNKIEKIRLLAREVGIPGHTSTVLDNVLKSFTISQAKTAMETTKRLQDTLKNEIFENLFPSRKDDAEQFIKLISLYEEMLEKISKELRLRSDELNRRTGLSSISLEIENSMNSIKQSFSSLTGENNASF
ncbi:MAG: hypothetical protein ACJAWW_000854 [Sulfurimonas sp.]|jgi:hypothetical protein